MATPVTRRQPFFNPRASRLSAPPGADENAAQVDRFHKQLPNSGPTRLVKLPALARELGVGAVYVKDESSRFGLPSFKILGASWGTFRALAQRVGLPLDTDVATLKKVLSSHPVTLYAATEGNHGRAVARMGSVLGVPTEIHVPAGMHEATISLISSEGAAIVRSSGNYDNAVQEAQEAAKKTEGILVQDFAFDGYEDIPRVSRINCFGHQKQLLTG